MRLIFLAILLASAQSVSAAEPCLTKDEFNDMSLFMLPAVLEGAASKCQAFLPNDSYLLNDGKARAEQLASAGETHKKGAIAAFAKMGGGKLPEGLSVDTLAGFVRDMAKADLFKKFTGADCAKVNEAAELLAPLPPENLSGLVRLLIEFGDKGDKAPPFRFCPAAPL
jgi:hypothetical protein